MIVTIEISYYPLTADYNLAIQNFIDQLAEKDVLLEIGQMSTLITGDYQVVMDILNKTMGEIMEQYPSVFNLKISNSCPIK